MKDLIQNRLEQIRKEKADLGGDPMDPYIAYLRGQIAILEELLENLQKQ